MATTSQPDHTTLIHISGCACAACCGSAANLQGHGSSAYIAPTPGGNGDGSNGSGNAVAALLQNISWTGQQGQAATVTYTYNSPSAGVALNATQQAANQQALQLWANVANINFVQVSGTGATAQLDFGMSSLGGNAAGLTNYYYNYTPTPLGTIADAYIQYDSSYVANPVIGNHPFATMLHEIGHALGLKHPGNYDLGSGAYGQTFYDNWDGSVMSYEQGEHANMTEGLPVSPMIYDIAAIQQLYGANRNFNSGNTTYTIDGTLKSQTIWDGAGVDVISGANVAGNHVIDLREGLLNVSEIGQSNIFIAFGANIENAIGGAGNDRITGNQLNNVLTGNGGNDTLSGGAGADTLIGGAGTDSYIISSGQGADRINDSDGLGRLTINGVIVAGTATLSGSTYTLALSGLTVSLSLLSAILNITVGGVLTAIVEDFQSGELGINLSGTTPVTPPTPPATNPQLISGTENGEAIKGTALADTISGLGGNDTIQGLDGHDSINAGAGNDIVYGGNGNDTLLGGDGDDNLNGQADNDVIRSGLGNDTLTGDVGNDRLEGEAGDDRLNGGAGNDTLLGGDGADTLNGGDDADSLDGGAGNDVVYGGNGNDTLLGGDGDDNLNGQADNDIIRGGNGNDTLTGDIGNDRLEGESGDDRVNGGAGNDTLIGGAGNDTLQGGDDDDLIIDNNGVNILYGGNGNDVFILSGAAGTAYTVYGQGGADRFAFEAGVENVTTRIQDFTQGVDKIDLSNFSADFSGIAKAAAAGSVLGFSYVGNSTVITGDWSGQDLVFTVNGKINLTANDFIF